MNQPKKAVMMFIGIFPGYPVDAPIPAEIFDRNAIEREVLRAFLSCATSK